jgi:outer membrane immunogenic protein
MLKIQTRLLAIAAIAALGTAAHAADMAVKAPPAPVVAPAPNWAGFYLGADGGGGFGASTFRYITAGTVPSPNPTNFDGSVLGGGFAGIQGQWSNIVVGVEGQWDGFYSLNATPTCPNTAYLCVQQAKQSWMVGPRAGIAFGNYLFYADGGYARTQTYYATPLVTVPSTVFDSAHFWHSGWYAGFGIDWMVMPNVIVGVNYRHIQADTATVNPLNPAGVPSGEPFTESAHIDMVTARVSYKFGWPL